MLLKYEYFHTNAVYWKQIFIPMLLLKYEYQGLIQDFWLGGGGGGGGGGDAVCT